MAYKADKCLDARPSRSFFTALYIICMRRFLSWFTNSKHFPKRMNEHFGLCSQWKSRCLETLMQLDATIDDVTATADQIYHISAWQSQWRHRLWRRELHMNLSRVSSALCGPRCLVSRPHYSARPKRFRPCGPSKVNWPRGTGETPVRN